MDISDFGARGHLPPGVALLLAAVLGMLLAVIEALGRGMQQRNAASQGRATKPSGHAATIPAAGKRRLQRSAIHDAEGSACGVLRKDFPSP